MILSTPRDPVNDGPPPSVTAARLATLRVQFLRRFGDPADAALLAELFEELSAIGDRLTYAESAIHHLNADLAELLNARTAGMTA